MKRWMGAFAASLLGCAAPAEDSGDAPAPCPYDVETFCAYEFGGACPTYEEAAAMTCDGYHFDPTGGEGPDPIATDGHKECRYPIVACHGDSDPNLRTSMYFDSTGPGAIVMIDLIWNAEENPYCNFNGVMGGNTGC